MSCDHRACFRFSLPEGQDRALLRWGWQNLPVQILNVSATGFLLACPLIEVNKGELLWLKTAAAWTRVRVVFLKPAGAETQLGVERLDELEETLETSSGWNPVSWLAPGLRAAGGMGNLTVALGVMAAMIAGALYLHGDLGRSSMPRRHLSHTVSGFGRDLERAWSEVSTAAGRFVPSSFGGGSPSSTRAARASSSSATAGSAGEGGSSSRKRAAAPDSSREKNS